MKSNENPAASSTERVYEAIVELNNQQQVATRYSVQALTGMPLGRVDDRIKALVIQERIKRQLKGQYVPVKTHPPARAISKTLMPDGMVKIEIGDDVLTLTPAEDRALSTLMAGAATQVSQIQANQVVTEMAATFMMKVDRIEKRQQESPSLEVAVQLAKAAKTIERVTAAARVSGRKVDERQADLGLDD